VTPEAFETALTRAEVVRVFNHARELNYSHGDDIAQDTLIAAWQGCRKFKMDCRFSTWLHRATVNTAFNSHRQRTFYRIPSQDGDAVQDESLDTACPYSHLVAERRLFLICDRLQAMKPAARDMFLKYRMTPISYQDLVGQVPKYKSRLNRATARLLEIE
jgi:RNA polymerase sigma-70 factor (ECF subfamily)